MLVLEALIVLHTVHRQWNFHSVISWQYCSSTGQTANFIFEIMTKLILSEMSYNNLIQKCKITVHVASHFILKQKVS